MNPELYHWGIKGMRWGIRRYQNEDGTFTEEGKTRYGRIAKEKRPSRKKLVQKMSDAELNSRINRLRKEREYLSLTEPRVKTIAKNIGKKIVFGIIAGAAVGLSTEIVKGYMGVGAKQVATSLGLPDWNYKDKKKQQAE